MTLDKERITQDNHLTEMDSMIAWISYSAVPSQTAVSAYFTSEQILPFGFAKQYSDPFRQIAEVHSITSRQVDK